MIDSGKIIALPYLNSFKSAKKVVLPKRFSCVNVDLVYMNTIIPAEIKIIVEVYSKE